MIERLWMWGRFVQMKGPKRWLFLCQGQLCWQVDLVTSGSFLNRFVPHELFLALAFLDWNGPSFYFMKGKFLWRLSLLGLSFAFVENFLQVEDILFSLRIRYDGLKSIDDIQTCFNWLILASLIPLNSVDVALEEKHFHEVSVNLAFVSRAIPDWFLTGY